MAVSKTNFIDPLTKEEFFFPQFTVGFKTDGGKRYSYKGSELVNPNTKTVLEFIDRPIEGDISFNVGKFSSMSREDQKASLKKRSKEHAKKHIRPLKEHMDRQPLI